ncbi:MAG TPA: matrixin family metalloprotease [Nitrosopumilaceae archaeon]|nr:matrixin family metalloprotease [Nitrosopumilaceae archaeon]
MDDHFLREIQQIQLIQKKLIQKLENTQDRNNSDFNYTIIEDLDQLSNFTARAAQTLSTKKIEPEFLTKLNDELRNPMVPIEAHANMLLSEKFGKLSDEQTNKLRTAVSNIKKLSEVINDVLNEKQSNVIETEIRPSQSQKIKELEQEKMLLGKLVEHEEKKNIRLSKKHVLTIAGFIATTGIIITAYSLFVVELVGQEYRVPNTGDMKDSYVIQNLKGDIIHTWLSWRLVDGTALYINIIGADKYPGKLDLIKDVVLSQDDIQVDDSLVYKGQQGLILNYHLGWAGALAKAAGNKTQLYIPQKLEVIQSPEGEGDITIMLTDDVNGDGYSGYTKSITDESQNQILKSQIIIYEVYKLNDEQFKSILRHELGHAFGLAHSTAPEDLMYPTILTQYPYISECDIETIQSLYDGNKKSEVTCQK